MGARSSPGNPYEGDTLAERWEQTGILMGVTPEQMIGGRGDRGREIDGPEYFTKENEKY